jgi:hypothetical protein
VRLRSLWLLGALLSLGCSVANLSSESNGPPPAENQCSSSDDCGGGVCQQGACVAPQGEIASVLFEVTPPASSGAGLAGIHFLKTMQVPTQGSALFDLALNPISTVSGTITPDAGTPSADAQCSYNLTFTPSEQVLGLTATSYTATTDASNAFSLDMPAGDYNLYIQPSPLQSTGGTNAPPPQCDVPPTLLLHQQIQSGDVKLPILLAPPEQLQVDVLSGQQALKNWTIDVIDPITHDVLSVPVTLENKQAPSTNDPNDPCAIAGGPCYKSVLEFSTVVGSSVVGHEFVRLSPPAGVAAPTVLMDRSALQVLTKDTVVVNQLQWLPEAVTVEGRVEVGTSSTPASATVTLAATPSAASPTGIDGLPPGTLASYVQTVQTDSSGQFSVSLLPGTYTVQAVPDASDLAISATTWQVGSTPSAQAGKVIGLAHAARLAGSVFTPGGDPLVGASVVATASPSAANDASTVGALNAAMGDTSPPPRAASDLIGTSGAFELNVDPGVFDFSVRPPDGTGFAWLVRPGVTVDPSSIKNMQHMSAPLPVAYEGAVTVDQVKVPGALVRAYVYLDGSKIYTSDADHAQSVLQVAETRAADDGTFTLLLPAQLLPPYPN